MIDEQRIARIIKEQAMTVFNLSIWLEDIPAERKEYFASAIASAAAEIVRESKTSFNRSQTS